MEEKERQYFAVEDWMVDDLGLRGSELLVYALIHSFTRDKGLITASYGYIAKRCGISRRWAIKTVDSLIGRKLVERSEDGSFWALGRPKEAENEEPDLSKVDFGKLFADLGKS